MLSKGDLNTIRQQAEKIEEQQKEIWELKVENMKLMEENMGLKNGRNHNGKIVPR